MSKHTAGPWHVDGDDRNEQIQIVSKEGSLVAVVTHECVRPRLELEANARLVANAPELYDILEGLVFNFDISGFADDSWWVAARDLLAAVRREDRE